MSKQTRSPTKEGSLGATKTLGPSKALTATKPHASFAKVSSLLTDSETPGTRLSSFMRQWTGAPPSTIKILARGYHWSWVSEPPPLTRHPRCNSSSLELRSQAAELECKGVVYKVPWQPAYIYLIFLSPEAVMRLQAYFRLKLAKYAHSDPKVSDDNPQGVGRQAHSTCLDGIHTLICIIPSGILYIVI